MKNMKISPNSFLKILIINILSLITFIFLCNFFNYFIFNFIEQIIIKIANFSENSLKAPFVTIIVLSFIEYLIFDLITFILYMKKFSFSLYLKNNVLTMIFTFSFFLSFLGVVFKISFLNFLDIFLIPNTFFVYLI